MINIYAVFEFMGVKGQTPQFFTWPSTAPYDLHLNPQIPCTKEKKDQRFPGPYFLQDNSSLLGFWIELLIQYIL